MSYPHILCWLQATVVEYTWCFGRMKYVLWQIFCGSNEMTLRVLVLAEFLWQQWYDVGRFVSCWINEFCFYLASVWSHRNTKTRSSHVFQRRCCCCCLPRARIVALSCYPQSQRSESPILIFTTAYESYFFSEWILFFSHNKSVNSTLQPAYQPSEQHHCHNTKGNAAALSSSGSSKEFWAQMRWLTTREIKNFRYTIIPAVFYTFTAAASEAICKNYSSSVLYSRKTTQHTKPLL